MIFRPLDGAICSLSHMADIASNIAMRALAASVCSSASSCSRLATSPGRASSGIAPKIFLRRGSIRGSFVIFEAMIASLVQWRREQLTRVRGWPPAFSKDRRRCRKLPLLPLPGRRWTTATSTLGCKWGDLGRIYVCIRKSDLAARRTDCVSKTPGNRHIPLKHRGRPPCAKERTRSRGRALRARSRPRSGWAQ